MVILDQHHNLFGVLWSWRHINLAIFTKKCLNYSSLETFCIVFLDYQTKKSSKWHKLTKFLFQTLSIQSNNKMTSKVIIKIITDIQKSLKSKIIIATVLNTLSVFVGNMILLSVTRFRVKHHELSAVYRTFFKTLEKMFKIYLPCLNWGLKWWSHL